MKGNIPYCDIHFPLLCKCCFYNSASSGMEGAAPLLDTVIEEALAHRSKFSPIGSPSRSPAMKYPVKVSPAAVVSTALTG